MLDPRRIVVGTANFHHYPWDSDGRRLVDPQRADAVVALAHAAGAAGFDTADGYGFGEAERSLGRSAQLIAALGASAVTTKLGYNFYNRTYRDGIRAGTHFRSLSDDAVVPFDSGREFSAEYLRFAADRSHDRLGRMDFNVLLHCPDADDIAATVDKGALKCLAELDYVLRVGISVKLPDEVFRVLQEPVVKIIQVPLFSLMSRAMRLAVSCARRSGIMVMANQPFGGGMWLVHAAERLRRRCPELAEGQAKHAAARALLQFVQEAELCDFIVVGVSSPSQVTQLLCGDDLAPGTYERTCEALELDQLLATSGTRHA